MVGPAPRRLLAVVALAAVLAGCTGSPPERAPDGPGPVPDRALRASIAQFRIDEGTRRLKAGVTNRGSSEVQVTQATIDWEPLAFARVTLPDAGTLPGQTAAFTITYGTPRCGRASRPSASAAPVLVAQVDGRMRRLPLHVDDPTLLDRLQAKACAARRLAAAAAVDFQLSSRTVRVDGEEYLPGRLVLRREATADPEPVQVVDLGGSVLIEVLPRSGRRSLPVLLAPADDTLDVPLLLGSVHRCDAHALGQSSQTFLLSAYLRLGSHPTQRFVLPLTPADVRRLSGVVHRDCA